MGRHKMIAEAKAVSLLVERQLWESINTQMLSEALREQRRVALPSQFYGELLRMGLAARASSESKTE